ncbi:hypothetical protein HGB13_03680, partial [bacterium]|nr:hypothetical protein [bacterium]
MFRKTRSYLTKFLIVSLVIFSLPQVTNAASLTALSDTMSRLKDSQASNHTIRFTTPTGVAGAAQVVVTFPTGFDVNGTGNNLDYTDIDVADDGVDVTLAAS